MKTKTNCLIAYGKPGKAWWTGLTVVRPPPRLLVSEWSERYRYLSREYSAQPGRYSLANVPYAREPLDCANDKSVRSVALMWASQTTKTTLLENVLGYFIAADPSPILLIQPTVEMAQAWSKERFNATVRDTPCLRDVISDPKSRDSGNTIQLKTFPGGNLAIIGANAPAGLAGRPRRVVLLDEVDRYPASAGTEGDPVALAIRRTESFWNSVIYLTSTPTIKNASRIEAEYEQTDKRKWFVPCPHCGQMQILCWANVRWDSGLPATARYECEKCGAGWNDAERVAAIRGGEWRATAPFAGKRGYFLSGIYSPFKPKRGFSSRLHQMATEFLEAKGNTEQLKTWTNTFLAETWEDQTERIEPSWLSQRVESYGPQDVPEAVALIIAGADVQKDRIEVEFIGIGAEEETWGVEVAKVHGDTEDPKTWLELSRCIDRTWRRKDGIELRCAAIGIDIHFRPRATKEWLAKHGTRVMCYGVFGIGSSQPTLVQLRPNGCWSIATDYAKDVIYARFKIEAPGPRFMHFPNGAGYSDDWFRQLTCERVVTKYNKGFAKRVYEKTSGVRNEALDMRVYGLGVLDILRPNIEAIQANLKPKPKQAMKLQPPAPIMPRQRGGFVGGWR